MRGRGLGSGLGPGNIPVPTVGDMTTGLVPTEQWQVDYINWLNTQPAPVLPSTPPTAVLPSVASSTPAIDLVNFLKTGQNTPLATVPVLVQSPAPAPTYDPAGSAQPTPATVVPNVVASNTTQSSQPMNAAAILMQSTPSGICVDAGDGLYEDTGNGAPCGPSASLATSAQLINPSSVASGICIQLASGAYVDSGNGTACTPTTTNATQASVTPATTSTDPITELENYSFTIFGVTITGLEAVLGIAAIGLVMAMSGKRGR